MFYFIPLLYLNLKNLLIKPIITIQKYKYLPKTPTGPNIYHCKILEFCFSAQKHIEYNKARTMRIQPLYFLRKGIIKIPLLYNYTDVKSITLFDTVPLLLVIVNCLGLKGHHNNK